MLHSHRGCSCWFLYFLCGNLIKSPPLLAMQVPCSCRALMSYLSVSRPFFLSLPCTHVRPPSVGVWRMTQLLHTSSPPGHIWAARKSLCLRLCSGEEPAMQEGRKRRALFYSLLFFSNSTCLYHHKDEYSDNFTLVLCTQEHQFKMCPSKSLCGFRNDCG